MQSRTQEGEYTNCCSPCPPLLSKPTDTYQAYPLPLKLLWSNTYLLLQLSGNSFSLGTKPLFYLPSPACYASSPVSWQCHISSARALCIPSPLQNWDDKIPLRYLWKFIYLKECVHNKPGLYFPQKHILYKEEMCRAIKKPQGFSQSSKYQFSTLSQTHQWHLPILKAPSAAVFPLSLGW